MKGMPRHDVVGSVAQCAVCFEAYMITDGMTDEEVERFRVWHTSHGVGCQRTPLSPLTGPTFSVLANLHHPAH